MSEREWRFYLDEMIDFAGFWQGGLHQPIEEMAGVTRPTSLTIEFDSLGFILEHGNIDLLLRLSVEQEGFHQTIRSWHMRNEFYLKDIQPILENKSLNKQIVTLQIMKDALGERLFGTAMSGAENITSNVNQATVRIPAIHEELLGVAKKIYPEGKFIKLVLRGTTIPSGEEASNGRP